MKDWSRKIFMVSTGTICTLFFLVFAFAGRYGMERYRVNGILPQLQRTPYFRTEGTNMESPDVAVPGPIASPSQLVAQDKEPNLISQSMVRAAYREPKWLYATLVRQILAWDAARNFYGPMNKSGIFVIFDSQKGLLVHIAIPYRPSESSPPEMRIKYAGPNGVAQSPGPELGRFASPVFPKMGIHEDGYTSFPLSYFLFEPGEECFYAINFQFEEVIRGPKIDPGVFQPIQVAPLSKNELDYHPLQMWARPPLRALPHQVKAKQPFWEGNRLVEREIEVTFHVPERVPPNRVLMMASMLDRGLFLNRDGSVWELDPETAAPRRKLGWLTGPPQMRASFPTSPAAAVDDLYAYKVQMIYQQIDFPGEARSPVIEPIGLAETTMTPEGVVSLGVFKEGTLVKDDVFNQPRRAREGPAGKFYQWGRLAAENLAPPAVNLASFFLGSRPAGEDARAALVILPYSYAAEQGRGRVKFWPDFRPGGYGRGEQSRGEPMITRLGSTLALLSPSLLLGAVLGWLAKREAAALGYAPKARQAWAGAILLLGIPGYLTWRLTRPRVSRVTCDNCGQLRRTDFARCQFCQAEWRQRPAPGWRISDAVPQPKKPHAEAAEAAERNQK